MHVHNTVSHGPRVLTVHIYPLQSDSIMLTPSWTCTKTEIIMTARQMPSAVEESFDSAPSISGSPPGYPLFLVEDLTFDGEKHIASNGMAVPQLLCLGQIPANV